MLQECWHCFLKRASSCQQHLPLLGNACVCACQSYKPKLCLRVIKKALPLILQSKPLIVFWNSLHKWLPDDWQGLWVGVTPLPGKTRVSFQVNFAGFSQKCLFNTTVTSNVQWLHRGHVGPLALSVVSPGSGWLKDAKRALLVVLQKDARRHYRWFHKRIPGWNKEQQPMKLYQFDIDVHVGESLQ